MATAAVGSEVGAVRLLLSRLSCASGRSFGGFGRPAFVAGSDARTSAEKCRAPEQEGGLLTSLFGDGWLLMGRGDPRTKRGKIFRKSNGKSRTTKKKARKTKEKIAPSLAPPLPDEFLQPFTN